MSDANHAPRGATEADRDSLRSLVGEVFRPSLTDEYPQLFHAANLSNCRVVEVDGKLVSHVGMTVQDAAIYGCRVRVACIGGVATHPDHRGAGHAGACLDDAIAVAIADGADVMIISGDRSLYRRAGCRRVGQDLAALLTDGPPTTQKTTLRDATEADIPTLRALHHGEPIHWKRDPDTWRRALECGWVMNRKSRFVIVEAHGADAAYFIAPEGGEPVNSIQISEYAGDRQVLLAAFAQHAAAVAAPAVQWSISSHDAYGKALAVASGAEVRGSTPSGTYIVLDPAQLVDRMRPFIREYVGSVADEITVQTVGEGYRVAAGASEHALPDRGCAAHFLFGTREDRATPAPASGPLADAFPFPALWYGVNYV
jgi:predicted N-acetyltransferase YhbS